MISYEIIMSNQILYIHIKVEFLWVCHCLVTVGMSLFVIREKIYI